MILPDTSSAAVPAARSVGHRVRAMLTDGRLDLALPGGGQTAQRWAALAAFGRADLAVARLAEGHTDAVAILAEAGRRPDPAALYGVWAARPGGRGAALRSSAGTVVLAGTVRFCSGAHLVDRALVIAEGDAGRVLVDVPVHPAITRPDPGSWRTQAMAAADTLDVLFDDVPVGPDEVLGPPDWYSTRPGFAIGGAGVAAVWWGGAAGLLDQAMAQLPATPDAHQLAHLGELDAQLAATDALLRQTASVVDADPAGGHRMRAARVRCAVERAVRETLDRVPRMLGPGPLSGDADLARNLADLGIYVRQHHAERDYAALGTAVLGGHRREPATP